MKDFKIYVLKGYSQKKDKIYTALCADVSINGKIHRIFLNSRNYFLYNELLEQMIKNGDVVDET